MRRVVINRGVMLVVLIAAACGLLCGGGCASDGGSAKKADSKSVAKSDAGPAKSDNAPAANMQTCMMQDAGKNVLRLTVAADAKCGREDGWLHLESGGRNVNIWLVRGAHDLGVLGQVSDIIAPEFKEFKATSTKPVTIAGAQALRQMGTGVEADDGDPGTADVVVFKVGERAFVACVHGESISADAEQWMMTLLETAHVP